MNKQLEKIQKSIVTNLMEPQLVSYMQSYIVNRFHGSFLYDDIETLYAFYDDYIF